MGLSCRGSLVVRVAAEERVDATRHQLCSWPPGRVARDAEPRAARRTVDAQPGLRFHADPFPVARKRSGPAPFWEGPEGGPGGMMAAMRTAMTISTWRLP